MEDNSKKKISNKYCSVPQCSSRPTKNVSLHYFPKDKQLCKKWLVKLRINKPASKYMNVCSLHFKDTDYFFPGVGTWKRYLKKGSIPSERLPQRSFDKKLSDLQITAQNQRAQRVERRVAQIEAATKASTENVNMTDVDTEEEISTIISSEVMKDMSVETRQNLIIKINTEDKGIQVTPSIISEHKKVTLYDMIKTNRDLNAFTGIPSLNLLENICKVVSMLEQNNTKSLLLSVNHRVVLVFVKLKTDLSFLCLSPLFGVSANTCKNYFETTLEVLSVVVKSTFPWLEKVVLKNKIPTSFKKTDNA